MDDCEGDDSAGALPCRLLFTALILKEPDLGTALVCMAVTALMLYLAGARMRYFAIGCGAGFAGDVLHAVSCEVPTRPDAGVYES